MPYFQSWDGELLKGELVNYIAEEVPHNCLGWAPQESLGLLDICLLQKMFSLLLGYL